MAYFSTYNSPFYTGVSYTASDDRSADLITHSNVTEVNGELRINGAVIFNGTLNGTTGDLVIFDRVLRFTSNTARLANTGDAGIHTVLVNCTIIFDDYFIGNNAPTIGYAANNSGTIRRNTAISGTKASDSTFSIPNCRVIMNHFGNTSNRFTAYLSDMTDAKFTTSITDIDRINWYVPPGVELNNAAFEFETLQSNYTDVFPVEFTGEVAGGEGVAFNGVVPYNFEGGTLEFPEFSVGKPPLASPLSATDGIVDRVAVTIGRNNSGQPNNNVFFMASPRVALGLPGACYFRGFVSGSDDNFSESYAHGSVVQAVRHNPRIFTDAAQATAREGTNLHYITDVSYTTVGDTNTLAKLDTQAAYNFVTNTNGYAVGPFNFVDGTTTEATFENVDVPILRMEGDTDFAISGRASDSTNTTSSYVSFSTTAEIRDWKGTLQVQHTFDTENFYDTDLAFAGGYSTPVQNDSLTSIDDTLLVSYDSEGNVTDKFVADTEVSPTDIYALYKIAWSERTRMKNASNVDTDFWVSYDDSPNPNVSMSILDISSSGVNNLVLSDSLGSDEHYRVVRNSASDIDFTIKAGTIATSSASLVQGIKATTIDLNSGVPSGGSLEGTFENVMTYTTIPLANELTFDSTELAGTINLAPASGETVYIQFKDCSVIDGGTLAINNSGAGTVIYLFQGDAITFTGNQGDVVGLTTVIIQMTDSDVSTTVYDITDDVYPTDSDRRLIVNIDSDTDGFTIASSGGDNTQSGLGTTITKLLIVGSKAGEDSYWETLDVSPGSSLTSNVVTTANSQFADNTDIPATAIISSAIDSDTDGTDDGKMVITCNGILAAGAGVTNKVLMTERGSRAYRDALAMANDNGTELIFPIGRSDSGFDAARVIMRTTQVNQSMEMTAANILNLAGNAFSQIVTAQATIDGADTELMLTVTRLDIPTGVPGDTFNAGLTTLEQNIGNDLDERLVTTGNIGNLGLGVPVKGTDGNLVTTPDV